MNRKTNTEKAAEISMILDECSCTRFDISKKLNMSSSGVSQIVSLMKSFRIIGEYQNKSAIGNSSGILHLKAEPVLAVACMMKTKITTAFFGYNLKLIDSFDFIIDDSLFFDNCLISYFKELSVRKPKCLCITSSGAVCSGVFRNTGISSLDGIPILEYANEFLCGAYVFVGNRYDYIPEHSMGMHMVISHIDGIFSTSVIHNGENISCKNLRLSADSDDLFKMLNINNVSVEEMIKYSSSSDEYAATIASLVNIISSLIQFDGIYFITDRYSSVKFITNAVESKLILNHGTPLYKSPQIIPVSIYNALFPEKLLKEIRCKCIDYLFSST